MLENKFNETDLLDIFNNLFYQNEKFDNMCRILYYNYII